VDDQVKDLFSQLKQRGLLENTIVIVTSDHGESLGEHGLLQHSASLYLDEIHVPLIIWAPGYVPLGEAIDTPVTLTSIAPTILSLIKSQANPFPEPTFTLLMSGAVPPDWPDPISELAQFDSAAEQNPSTHGEMKSVVDKEMQFIIHEKFGEELYNWQIDPHETNNLITAPASQTIANAFKAYLEKLIGVLFKTP
jgi:arylsulfatase A-like enzyme